MFKKIILFISCCFSIFYSHSITFAATGDDRKQECAASQWCIDQDSFMIDTRMFSDGGQDLKKTTAKDTINNVLWTLIQKLMIALWVIALFVMTIWAWYIIFNMWEDQYRTKWISIFTGWLIALVVALCSYYMVNAIAYILYK